MAKKIHAKDKRAAREQAKKQAFQQKAEEKRLAEEAEAERLEQERLKALELAKLEIIKKDLAEKSPLLLNKKKSSAKAVGLKSTFVMGGDLLMTSFGRGSKAISEHLIGPDGIEARREAVAFSVEKNGVVFDIKGKNGLTAISDDPRHRVDGEAIVGADMIGAKEPLERRFFGQSFPYDNIHIQLIYSILDIEKILSTHINNIVYSINNIMDNKSNDDFVGHMGFGHGYTYELFRDFDKLDQSGYDEHRIKTINRLREQFFALLKNPRLGYFGSAFYKLGSNVKSDMKSIPLRNEEDIFYTLILLGEVRQALAHGTENTASVYNLDTAGNDGVRRMLDSLYSSRIDELNADFGKYAEKDLTILYSILGTADCDKVKVAEDYYSFVVKKSYKNIGFSIKTLREKIVDLWGIDRDDKDFSSVRHKLYKLLDFIIYSYYEKNPDMIEKNMAILRASVTEAEKELLYTNESERMWEILRDVIHALRNAVNGRAISGMKVDGAINNAIFDRVRITDDADYFSKMIYAVTLFQDGKEINDLITTLINKFENIASFIDVLRENGLKADFDKQYSMFDRAEKIAEELSVIRSFARMEKPHASAKGVMFLDAMTLLGTTAEESELSEYINGILEKARIPKAESREKTFRNFIASNVIESDRFNYLIRYTNARTASQLARNKKLIRFVLSGLPESQLARYCQSCRLGGNDTEARLDLLTDFIAGMDFKRFENVPSARSRNEERNTMQAMISLYLTVIYLVTKNLVYINSRYFLAFHCLERDKVLLLDTPDKDDYLQLTNLFISENRLNRHATEYLTFNIEKADQWAIRSFRNTVDHLNAVRNAGKYVGDIKSIGSYYELYHYVVQRTLCDSADWAMKSDRSHKPSSDTVSYCRLVRDNYSYCKDFVKVLNAGFGYNLARYKNLSIDGLFDRNRASSEEEKKAHRTKRLNKVRNNNG